MDVSQKITDIKNIIFQTEDFLDRDIAGRVITSDLIDNFDILSKEIDSLSQKSFDIFENNAMDQMITFGSLSTAKDICSNIKINLETAMARNENPISAERVKRSDYLTIFHFIIESIGDILHKKAVDDITFTTLNESIKGLILLSKNDKIYDENIITFSSSDSEKVFVEIFTETDNLFKKI